MVDIPFRVASVDAPAVVQQSFLREFFVEIDDPARRLHLTPQHDSQEASSLAERRSGATRHPTD